MRTIRLVIEYDGTQFHGWAIQGRTAGGPAEGEHNRTVQGTLEAALSALTKEEIRTLERLDLIHIIKVSQVFSSRSWVEQFGFMDRN